MQLVDINHNPDLKRLEDEGYVIEVNGSHLLVHEIPYVNSKKKIERGTIVTVLSFLDPTKIGKPINHTANFIGEAPCDENGNKLLSIINESGPAIITTDFHASIFFSYKPLKGDYENYYEKVRTYAHFLTSYAKLIDPSVTEKPGKIATSIIKSNVFRYPDTNSARAKIDYENTKFHNLKIGIVGVGGTGSYILDLVSKTQVKEIHIFDDDVLELHNTFRAPGTVTDEIIQNMSKIKKVDYYYSVYTRMHLGIKPHSFNITSENIYELYDFDYVFVCVHTNEVRFMILDNLTKNRVPFSDVGLGVVKKDSGLLGTIRVTSADQKQYDHLNETIGRNEDEENEYNTNIQIADLNCLNASLAVIKWKRHVGFYVDLKDEHHTLYHIETNKIINDNFTS